MRSALVLTSMLAASPAGAAPASGLKDPFTARTGTTAGDGAAATTDLHDPWAVRDPAAPQAATRELHDPFRTRAPRDTAVPQATGELHDPFITQAPPGDRLLELKDPWARPTAPTPAPQSELRDPFREPTPAATHSAHGELRDPWAPGGEPTAARPTTSDLRDPWAPGSPVRDLPPVQRPRAGKPAP